MGKGYLRLASKWMTWGANERSDFPRWLNKSFSSALICAEEMDIPAG
jgi:hypothetical protein